MARHRSLLKISTEDIYEYYQCPMKFKLNGWKPEPKAKPKLVELPLDLYIEQTHTECVKFMLKRHAFDGTPPSMGATLRLWNEAWKYIFNRYGKTEKMEDRYIKETFKVSSYHKRHMNKTKLNKQIPIMYDYEFILNYDNVDVVGHIDFGFQTPRRFGDDVLDIGFIGLEPLRRIRHSLRSDFNVLSAIYKLREDYKMDCQRILYYNPKTMKWLTIPIHYTNTQLHTTISDACKSLYNRIGFRNPGPQCSKCPYNKNPLCEF